MGEEWEGDVEEDVILGGVLVRVGLGHDVL